MSDVFIQTKITTPRLHDKIVHRERLTNLLNEHINKSLIVICSPAGFGKTTLAVDYVTNQNKKYIWFSIPHRGINDVSTFFEYLIHAMKNINEKFGSVTIEIMKSYYKEPGASSDIVSVLAASFVNEFHKAFKDDVIIVIDDLHYIDSEHSLKWLNEVFNELFENIPVNLHLIIITRRMPDFKLTELNAKRNIFITGENELNFKQDEIAQLLEQVYSYKYDVDDIILLEDKLKGWITGIHLLLQAYGEDFNKIEFSSEIAAENTFDFFAHEIFENLNGELQEFLMITSLPENFNIVLCNSIPEIKHSDKIINELINKNLFISMSSTPAYSKEKTANLIYYSYHALFRQFLLSKIRELKTEQEIKCLRKKIAEYYENTSDVILAVNYYIEAEEFERTVRLITQNFDAMYGDGKLSILWRWLGSLPDKIKNNNADLIYFMGILSREYLGDIEKSLLYANKALGLLKLSQNEDTFVSCYCLRARTLSRLGKTEQAIGQLNELLKEDLKPENRARILFYLGAGYTRSRQFTESNYMLEQALSICNEHNIKEIKSELYNSLGVNNGYNGKFMNAIFYYEKAIDEAVSIRVKYTPMENLVSLYSDIGDFSKAREYAEKVSQALASYPSKHHKLYLLLGKAGFLLNVGDYERSQSVIKECYHLAEIARDEYIMFLCNWELSGYFRYMNNQSQAFEYLKRAREHISTEADKSYCDVYEAALLTEDKLAPSAEDKLLNAYTYFDSVNGKSEICEAAFYLANYYLMNDLSDNSLRYLKISLQIAISSPYVAFFQNELLKSRAIFDFALSNPELKLYGDFIKSTFEACFDKLKYEWLSDECKARLKVQIESLYDINMTSFGGLNFSIRGMPVTESKWRKKRGKLILTYLMLNRKTGSNKNKVMDIFFPEAGKETAENNFRQAIFNIRSVLKVPYLDMLIYEGKTLTLNPDCYYKSDAGEFDKYYKTARSPETNIDGKIEACKKAIGLYKGELLEGYYEPWCEELREEYAHKFISVTELLLSSLREKKSYDEVISYSEELLTHDNLNGQAYLGMVEAYTKLGNIKLARETYAKMLKLYKNELGEKPNRALLEKIEQLLSG